MREGRRAGRGRRGPRGPAGRGGPSRAAALPLHRVLFAIERFQEHELANHAAAGAYAFLLSATPALLLAIGLARLFLERSPDLVAGILGSVRTALGPLGAEAIERAFFSRPVVGLAAGLGSVGLVWAARLFVMSVQRGLRVVWGESAQVSPLRANLLPFALELLCLLVAMILLAASTAARPLVEFARPLVGPGIAGAVLALLNLAPFAALGSFAYITYRFSPKERPRPRHAALAALLCVLAYSLLARLLDLFIDGARYDLLYGLAGGIVLLLVKVFAFFTIYFHCAEFAYVSSHFDALLFGRFFRVTRSKRSSRVEKALFASPDRLLRRYGRRLSPGQTVFRAGDTGRAAYFVESGGVGIWIEAETGARKIATIGPGELFGEIAHLLEEPRTASARAEEESVVLELPPAIFDHFLAHDAAAARGIIDTLSSRLKAANARLVALAGPDAAPGGEGEP